jgi:hypothetical protein
MFSPASLEAVCGLEYQNQITGNQISHTFQFSAFFIDSRCFRGGCPLFSAGSLWL